jgi:hypothetical protein
MIECIFPFGEWLGMLATLYGACVVITHDSDALREALEISRQRDSW